jgi:hypothetical protein
VSVGLEDTSSIPARVEVTDEMSLRDPAEGAGDSRAEPEVLQVADEASGPTS